MDSNDGCFKMFLVFGIGFIVGISVWSMTEPDHFKTTAPIQPEIELTVKDNIIDTLYIYREPK